MLDLGGVVAKSDGPIGVVVTDGRRDEEATRQFRVHDDLVADVELLNEGPLDLGVGYNVLVDTLLQLLAGLRQVLSRLVLGEDRRVVAVVERVVRQVLDDDCRLLLVDEPGRLSDELLGVLLELREGARMDAGEDRGAGDCSPQLLSRHVASL